MSRAAAAREQDMALPSSSSESWKSLIELERSSKSAWERGGVVTRSIISWSYSRGKLTPILVIERVWVVKVGWVCGAYLVRKSRRPSSYRL